MSFEEIVLFGWLPLGYWTRNIPGSRPKRSKPWTPPSLIATTAVCNNQLCCRSCMPGHQPAESHEPGRTFFFLSVLMVTTKTQLTTTTHVSWSDCYSPYLVGTIAMEISHNLRHVVGKAKTLWPFNGDRLGCYPDVGKSSVCWKWNECCFSA